MSNKEAYEALSNSGLQWGRQSTKTIYVWTQGYKTMDHYNLEKFLMQAGMRMINEEFDSMCGKTMATFKHK